MSRFEQRLTRIEQRMGMKSRQRMIYLTPNLEGDKAKETPYAVKISSQVWAHVLGNSGPFTNEEIAKLREKYAEERKIYKRNRLDGQPTGG
jgi:hypothetical protein